MALRVAMVGGGYFGRFQINAWRRLADVELIGVAEANRQTRSALEEAYPGLRLVEDVDKLLSIDAIDLLDVATEPASHAQIIRPLLGRLPAIICQKPFCRDLQEAEALTSAARQAGTTLVVHENFRFMPWYRLIRQIIDEGRLGTLRQAHFRMRSGDGGGADAYLGRQPYFRQMKKFLVHETAIHWINTFRFLFGPPADVYADVWRTNPVIAGEDSGLIIFSWPNGLRATYDANRTLDHAADNHRLTMGEFVVEGSAATLSLNGYGEIFLRRFGANQAENVACPFDDIDFGADCVFHFQKHVLAHLSGTGRLETGAAEYLANLRIEEAVYRSAAQGTKVALGA